MTHRNSHGPSAPSGTAPVSRALVQPERPHLLEHRGRRPRQHQDQVAGLGADRVDHGLHLVAGEHLVLDRLAKVGAVGGQLGVEQAAGPDLLADDVAVQLVHRLAPALALAGHVDRDDRAAVVEDRLEHLEARAAHGVRHVRDLHPEPEVGLVRAEPADGVGVGHPGERGRDLDAPRVAPDVRDQALDQGVDALLGGERHLDVDLGELRLAVGAQVLVPKALGDLNVAVQAGHHQDLLVRLRALGECVELTRVDAAGHQVVARALGRRLHEDGRLDLDEVVRVEVAPGALVQLRPEQEVALQRRLAQVEVTVLQPQLVAGDGRLGVVLGHHERRRVGDRQHLDAGDVDLDAAGRDLVGRPLALSDLARHRDHVLTAHPLRQRGERRVQFGAKH